MVDRQLEWQVKNQNYMLGIPDQNRDDVAEGIENMHGDIVQMDRANPAMDPDRQENTNTNPSFLSDSITGIRCYICIVTYLKGIKRLSLN